MTDKFYQQQIARDQANRRWWYYPLALVFYPLIWPLLLLHFLIRPRLWVPIQDRLGEPGFSLLVLVSGWAILGGLVYGLLLR